MSKFNILTHLKMSGQVMYKGDMAQFVYDNCPSSKEWAKEYYNRGR